MEYLELNTLSRRELLKNAGVGGLGLIYTRPVVDTLRPRPAFASPASQDWSWLPQKPRHWTRDWPPERPRRQWLRRWWRRWWRHHHPAGPVPKYDDTWLPEWWQGMLDQWRSQHREDPETPRRWQPLSNP